MLTTPLPLSLFGAGPSRVADRPRFRREQLDPCCWVDRAEGFVVGADSLFAQVEQRFTWERGRRLMYGRWLDEPRLTSRLELDDAVVPPVVVEAAAALERHYGRPFRGLFCNFYRSGSDGVAWHADRIGRRVVDPLVAIISLGGPRTFSLRDRSGESSAVRWPMHSGDLLVMGGATQHHWEHAIAKVADAPPRISLTTRAGWPTNGWRQSPTRLRSVAGGGEGSASSSGGATASGSPAGAGAIARRPDGSARSGRRSRKYRVLE